MEKKAVSRVLQVEFIWWGGHKPVRELCNKTRIARLTEEEWRALHEGERNDVGDPRIDPSQVDQWTFDGSSTYQALGRDSDLYLKPIYATWDPVRGKPNILVAAEVLMPDRKTPHESDTRHKLASAVAEYGAQEPLAGIEQEYTLFIDSDDGHLVPLAWGKRDRQPEKQGRYYCGTGADRAYGREVVETHTKWAIDAGLQIDGTNAEVMPGQWEFQLGPLPPLELCDQMMVMQWLLHLAGEKHGITISFAPKPVKNYNGAGAHTNFSVAAMRGSDGEQAVQSACSALERDFEKILPLTGHGNQKRLTGAHETCAYGEFKAKERDRGASVRIPAVTSPNARRIEFRTVAANADYYQVLWAMLESICGGGFKG